MSNVLITPLMNLSNPVPGVDPGPDYANNLYNSLNIIDGHNHSVGSGNQINSNGILINADLPFASLYNLTLLRSLRFAPQSAPLSLATDLGCLYESGVDLYFNDGSGNQVRITSGGSVNATSSGITSGTASASFSGGVLIVDSASNTPGNVQCGSVLIGNNTAGSNFVTLSAPSGLASGYPVVLPSALPGGRDFLTLDNSGNLATGVAYAGGLTTSNLSASAGILKTQIQSVGQQISTTCGNFSSASGSYVDVTNLTVTITTSGRPVMLILQSDGNGSNPSLIQSTAVFSTLAYIRDGSIVGSYSFGTGSNVFPGIPVFFDYTATAATHTYKIQGKTAAGVNSFIVANYILVAYEAA